MAYYFDPILNMPRPGRGLSLRITNNLDGTATLNWSGYGLETIDEDGTWRVQESDDGVNWTQVGGNITSGTLTADVDIPDPATLYRYRVIARNEADDETLATSNVASLATANEPITGLNITATDNGSGTIFNLLLEYTKPTGYTDTLLRVDVFVNDILLISGNYNAPDEGLLIEDLAGEVMDSVDVDVYVVGRTSVLGAPSTVASDTDWINPDYDADAQEWVDDIETELGTSIDPDDKAAIGDCVVGLKAVTGNYWDDIYSMGLFWFADASANAVRAKIGSQITFPSGTVTHGADYLTFSSNGYANLGFSPSTAGQTPTSNGLMFASTSLSAGDVIDFGARTWTGGDGSDTNSIFINAFGNSFYDGNARLTGGGNSNGGGLFAGNRLSGDGQLLRQHSGGLTSLATSASLSGGSTNTLDFFLGGRNNSGSVENASNRPYMFWLVPNKGVSQTKLEDALVYIYAMLATRGL